MKINLHQIKINVISIKILFMK